MKETIISFETAKLAKEKGFTTKGIMLMGYTSKFYNHNTKTLLSYGRTGRTDLKKAYFAPTQALLQKWLREEHEIHIEISFYDSTISKHYEASIVNSSERIYNNQEYLDCAAVIGINIKFKTYEEAFEKALQESLKLIKN